MNYCRTDLCPDCGTRLNLDTNGDGWSPITMVDYPMMLQYRGIFYYTIKCSGCPALWTKQEVLEHWAAYMVA